MPANSPAQAPQHCHSCLSHRRPLQSSFISFDLGEGSGLAPLSLPGNSLTDSRVLCLRKAWGRGAGGGPRFALLSGVASYLSFSRAGMTGVYHHTQAHFSLSVPKRRQSRPTPLFFPASPILFLSWSFLLWVPRCPSGWESPCSVPWWKLPQGPCGPQAALEGVVHPLCSVPLPSSS